jgi:hypothetical protein
LIAPPQPRCWPFALLLTGDLLPFTANGLCYLPDMRQFRSALFLAGTILTAQPVAAQPAPPAADLIARASAYVVGFVDTLSNVVADEDYVQYARSSVRDAGERRELRADFLLVRATFEERWTQFRDVSEVDGHSIRDSAERLRPMLSRRDESELERGRRMANESARYNIGIRRTFNLPLYAIGFLQPREVPRFRFEVERPDPRVGRDVWVVSFQESIAPTVVRENGRDVPTSGRFWISSASGVVWRTEWRVPMGEATAIITTEFATDRDFPVLVPTRMREECKSTSGFQLLSASATYGRFRRFMVMTEEIIQHK